VAWKGGTAAMSVDWDASLGNHVATASDGTEVFQGDTVETVLSIAEFVVEPGVLDAEKARWWIKVQALPPGEVRATYGLPDTPPGDITAGMTPFQRKLMASSKGHSDEMVDLTLVLTYYERPNGDAPKGRVGVVVNGKMVDGPKPWPFPWKDHLNLAVSRESILENAWAGDTVLTQAIPVQTLLNLSWSSIAEHMKLAGNARLMVPQSSMDLIEQMSDLPGELVPFADGQQPPTWQSPPQMPGWWLEQPQVLSNELDDLMGVHDVSRGQAPVNIESGVGLSVLAENDTTPVGRLAKEQAGMFSKVATMVLKLYEVMVTDTRKAVISTPGQPAETARWNGKDLQGQTSAKVPLDAILPRSRAALKAQADSMLQMGLITSIAQYASVAELPDAHRMIDALSPDIARARRENAIMAQGQVAIPMEIDDHAIHMDQHRTFMKSPRFDLMSEDQKQVYYDHIQAHEVMQSQAIAQQRTRAAIDPALGAMPDKTGAPPLPPELLMSGLQPEAAAPGSPAGGTVPPGGEEAPPAP